MRLRVVSVHRVTPSVPCASQHRISRSLDSWHRGSQLIEHCLVIELRLMDSVQRQIEETVRHWGVWMFLSFDHQTARFVGDHVSRLDTWIRGVIHEADAMKALAHCRKVIPQLTHVVVNTHRELPIL